MIETNLKGTTFVISNEREGLEANFGRCILRKIIKIFIFEREREREREHISQKQTSIIWIINYSRFSFCGAKEIISIFLFSSITKREYNIYMHYIN